MPGAPNPEAIAWYLARSEDLLGELRERIQSLRDRGGQIAGFSGAVLALAGANVDSVLGALHGAARDLAGGSLLLGPLLLVLSLVTVLRGTFLPDSLSASRPGRSRTTLTERFIHEPTYGGFIFGRSTRLQDAIETTTRQGDEAVAVGKSRIFLFVRPLFGRLRVRYFDRGGDVLKIRLPKLSRRRKSEGR